MAKDNRKTHKDEQQDIDLIEKAIDQYSKKQQKAHLDIMKKMMKQMEDHSEDQHFNLHRKDGGHVGPGTEKDFAHLGRMTHRMTDHGKSNK